MTDSTESTTTTTATTGNARRARGGPFVAPATWLSPCHARPSRCDADRCLRQVGQDRNSRRHRRSTCGCLKFKIEYLG
jgi:hypothetical protein